MRTRSGSSRALRSVLLACGIAAWLAVGERSEAQPKYLRVASHVSLSVRCNEPGCDCIDASGAPAVCPATHVRHYDSGNVALPTSDLYDAEVSGTFVGFTSTTTSNMGSEAHASVGTLKGLTSAHSDSAGAYVDATDTVTVSGTDGDELTLAQAVTLDSHARQDGGLGLPTNPNRARSADALLDASNRALLYIEVLTPGASYTSASGTVYAVPEVAASDAAALASLLAACRLSRRRS